jgi:hypothetical protein
MTPAARSNSTHGGARIAAIDRYPLIDPRRDHE